MLYIFSLYQLTFLYSIFNLHVNLQLLPLANAFYRGLTDLISSSWLSLFNANEFNQVIIVLVYQSLLFVLLA